MSTKLTRKLCTILGSGVLTASFAVAPEAKASLVAFYDFEDHTQDVSGNGMHGTVVGTEEYSSDVPTAIAGRSTKSFSFIEDNTYVNLPVAVSIADLARTGGATMSMWFVTNSANSGYLYSEGLATHATPIYGLQVGSGDDPNLRFQHRTQTTPITSGLSDTHIVDDEWHHIALVTVGANVKLYIDGVLDTGFADFNHPDVAHDGDQVVLGALKRITPSFDVNGRMDEVAFYDRGLTPFEISALASGVSPAGVPEPASLALLFAGLTLAASRRRCGAVD